MVHCEPMQLIEFQRRFVTEEACREHLFNVRWPNGFECPRCSHKHYSYVSTRNLYQCKACGYQAALTAGTIMHRTRTPLHVWFWAIYLVSRDKRGKSALSLSKELNISYWKAWTMLHKIRRAMTQRDAHYQLGNIVEIDDAYFGAPGGKRGRGTSKSKVIVAVSTTEEGKPQFAKMKVVENIDKKTLNHVAAETIKSGATVRSDGLNSYGDLAHRDFRHEVIETSKGLLPWVHVLISNAKAAIQGTFHGLHKKHMQQYLDEFCYRFNRRFWEPQLFGRLLNACVCSETITYAELTQ